MLTTSEKWQSTLCQSNRQTTSPIIYVSTAFCSDVVEILPLFYVLGDFVSRVVPGINHCNPTTNTHVEQYAKVLTKSNEGQESSPDEIRLLLLIYKKVRLRLLVYCVVHAVRPILIPHCFRFSMLHSSPSSQKNKVTTMQHGHDDMKLRCAFRLSRSPSCCTGDRMDLQGS